jgi:hypothetical protein
MGKGSDAASKAIFHALKAKREEIEQAFGGELDWQALPTRIGCRICVNLDGGWKTPESDWHTLQDRMLETMIRLETALKVPIQAPKTAYRSGPMKS